MKRRHLIASTVAGGASLLALAASKRLRSLFCLDDSIGPFNFPGSEKICTPQKIKGAILGANNKIGHLLRDSSALPAPTRTLQSKVVIVGGGIAGLSAAWWLQRQNFDDFTLLEMDSEVGGNSLGGANNVSPYPWGAHYVPLPGEESLYVRMLFEELNIIEGYDQQKKPIYNEFFLCADPAERLYIHGRWQEGLLPQFALTPEDQKDYAAFHDLIETLKSSKGKDGKPAFTIPIAASSADEQFTQWDKITMDAFMKQQGWLSKPLNWYINYCCRDDYGVPANMVSAWAGLHYFAARAGVAANAGSNQVVTWPEGNHWLVKKLHEKLASHISSQQLVFDISQDADAVILHSYDPLSQQTSEIKAQQVIFAAPRFTANRMIAEYRQTPFSAMPQMHYAPWLVANITTDKPLPGKGASLSWDNVNFHGKSLGYICATHQNLTSAAAKTVLTFFMPLTETNIKQARIDAADKSHQQWCQMIMEEMSAMHPELAALIDQIDIWIWGHAMIVPTPGYIWGQPRLEASLPQVRIHFAHSDMSGISIFEEAQFQGVTAAKNVLQTFGKRL